VNVGEEALGPALHAEDHVRRAEVVIHEVQAVDAILEEVLVGVVFELLFGAENTAIVAAQRVEHDPVHGESLALELVRQVVEADAVQRINSFQRLPGHGFGTALYQCSERLVVELVECQAPQVFGELLRCAGSGRGRRRGRRRRGVAAPIATAGSDDE
jgi:hypothetical protein